MYIYISQTDKNKTDKIATVASATEDKLLTSIQWEQWPSVCCNWWLMMIH